MDRSSGFVTINTVAEMFNVSVPTVRVWVSKGHIPKDCIMKVGSTYRFDLDRAVAALFNRESAAEKAHAEEFSAVAALGEPKATLGDSPTEIDDALGIDEDDI